MNPVLRWGGEIALTLLCSWAWVRVFVLPLCGLLFRCGCTWLWAGGMDHCNIYEAMPPHCPWCSAPAWAAWIPFRGLIVFMAVAAVVAGRHGAAWWRRPLAAVLTFLIVGLLSGWLFAVAMAYPTFLWFGAP